MKLNIASNKNQEVIDNGMTIQDKVNKIMGIETTNNETKNKGINNMKLSISNKTESIKPKKLELKINKGINQENLDLNINKFNQVESILKKLDSIDNTFINFLNNQNSAIEIINSFDKRIDTIELITTNLIKNQKSILDSINALHANLFQDNKKESKEVETKEVKTVLRKKESKEVDTESINGIFDIFQEYFGNNNFLGSKELTPETMPIFQALIESIEIDSIDSIQESINKFRSQLTKESGKYMTARKSNSNFDSAIIKTIEKIAGKSFDIAESKKASEIINKDYFTNQFNTDINTISDLINEITAYGKIDNELIDSVSNYIDTLSNNVSDNIKGKFINYSKQYIQ